MAKYRVLPRKRIYSTSNGRGRIQYAPVPVWQSEDSMISKDVILFYNQLKQIAGYQRFNFCEQER